MTSKRSALGLYCALLFYSIQVVSANATCDCKKEDLQQVKTAFRAYKRNALLTLKQILAEQQPCAQVSCNDPELNKELQETKAQLELKETEAQLAQKELNETKAKLAQKEQNLEALSKALTTPISQKLSANVPQKGFKPVVRASVSLSCESHGQPLNLCLWEQLGKINSKIIITNDGSLATEHGLDDGRCKLQLLSVKQTDSGYWACSLVGKNGSVFTGRVNLEVEEPDSRLYFALGNGDIVALSPQTLRSRIIRSTGEGLVGLAFDRTENLIYWSTLSKISRAVASDSGSNVEIVLGTTRVAVGKYWSLKVDWITGNLYVVTDGGYIIVCDGRSRDTGAIGCSWIARDQGELRGITLRPDKGIMYWTRRSGYILQGGMDGSNVRTLISGLVQPCGIQFYAGTSRLYWADEDAMKIQSCNDQGADIRTLVNTLEKPFGIAVFNDQIFWGHYNSRPIVRGTIKGQDRVVVFSGAGDVKQFDVPNGSGATSRMNPCESQNCSSICVLTPAMSARCLG